MNPSTLVRRCRRALLLGSALTMLIALPAYADDVTGSATVTAGTLAMAATDPPKLTATLNGTDQNVTDTITIDAQDNTGSGGGWKLQVTSTTFSTGGATPKTLATTATAITGVTSICDAGTCTAPTNGVTYPLTVPAAGTAPAAVSFFTSAVNTGMGDFTITPTFRVTVPANTYAGTYTSTMSITIASGPS